VAFPRLAVDLSLVVQKPVSLGVLPFRVETIGKFDGKEADNAQVGGTVGKPSVKHLDESREGMQLSFFQLDDPVLSQIRDEILGLDINNLTPMEALNKLNDIKKIVGG